jgi:hypothetical protein
MSLPLSGSRTTPPPPAQPTCQLGATALGRLQHFQPEAAMNNGAATSSQEQPGAATKCQKHSGAARSGKKQPFRFQQNNLRARASVRPMSEQCFQSQMNIFGGVALPLTGGPRRRLAFVRDALHFQLDCHMRRVGRPRQTWTAKVYKECSKRVGADVV